MPGTFLYDFFTGPAIGGLGALVAALLIAGVTVKVSGDRREDATKDRTAERERTRREEWFRRLQWAQGLTGPKHREDTRAVGFNVLFHLASSDLATPDDLELLESLFHTHEITEQELADDEIVDETDYVLDDEDDEDDAQAEESAR